MVLKICVHRSHREISARLSAPINQTKRVCGKRRRSATKVSAVYCVRSSSSKDVTRMRGCLARARALRSRSVRGAIPLTGFKGFCGDTSHQTSSNPSFRKAVRLISRCPACAGLKEPPRIPTRRGARRGLGRWLRPNLARPADDIFDAG